MSYPYPSDPTPPPDNPVPPAYQYPQPVYQYLYRPPETEGLAIASLVVSCAAVPGLCGYGFGGILGIVGAIMGHVARRRIARNGTNGAGMALAGIIVGWTAVALLVAAIVLIVVLVTLSESDPNW
ncbi:DUF4190 domain-containing protein [Paractinoplanes rhizophilus]|uniref:DUF4190 domain-containing protein n=1 Tax=Paractinoplanes rhizophilus TaxID=1416877 RepID=A0ABW2HN87_9ACTN|nr:DUF4190 domain-containing protein [Actinoplanes sp.]